MAAAELPPRAPAPASINRAGAAPVDPARGEVLLPAVIAGVIELAALAAFARGYLPAAVLLALHAAVVAALTWWVTSITRRGRNGVLPLFTLIAVAATGPVGAAAVFAVLVFGQRQPDDAKRLDDWYTRIANAVETDATTRLCEQVATGRTADLGGALPVSFAAVMARGSLDDRQAALGIIARAFDPAYLPALMLALKSPEPVIRVQAAAVATKVRGDLRALVDRHAASAARPAPGSGAALTAAAHLDAAIASGLLDESDRIRAGVIAARLRTADGVATADASHTAVDLLDRPAVEAMLLSAGRYGEIRVGRRIAAVETARLFRVRRPRRAAPAEAH
jgi:polysaccharide biosynthesis protein PelE